MVRKRKENFRDEAAMPAFLQGFLEPYLTVMDPNDLLAMAWKWQRADVARHTGGDLATALARITAKTFVMPIDEDMFFPVRDCRAEQGAHQGQRAARRQRRARPPRPVRRGTHLHAAACASWASR